MVGHGRYVRRAVGQIVFGRVEIQRLILGKGKACVKLSPRTLLGGGEHQQIAARIDRHVGEAPAGLVLTVGNAPSGERYGRIRGVDQLEPIGELPVGVKQSRVVFDHQLGYFYLVRIGADIRRRLRSGLRRGSRGRNRRGFRRGLALAAGGKNNT